MMMMNSNSNRPATAEDELLQKACAKVHYTAGDMDKLRAMFAKNDEDNSGSLDIDEFYQLFATKKSAFGDALFRLCELDGSCDFLSFSEFVSVVSTYCLFGPVEILRFAFNVVDEDNSGFVSLKELDGLASWLHEDGPANLNTAIARIRQDYDKGDGQISFESFQKINRQFPFLFHPAFALQETMMRRVLGQRWWDRKRKELKMVKNDDEETKLPEGPGVFNRMFPSIFPYKKPLSPEEEAALAAKEAAENAKWGRGASLPSPGPELLAYREFVGEVEAVDNQMELERKERRRKAASEKRQKADYELKLKRERTSKRRSRMLPPDMMDPYGQPIQLSHQPSSVVPLFAGKM
jgi:Ca2+-binding EF-hand superfamily protein